MNPSPPSDAAVRPPHRHRWHRRLRHRLGHSLGTRLVALFVVLALAVSIVFLGGMQRAFSGGWRDVVRPLVADYVDRLAADLGAPPRIDRARELVDALPLSIRIEGPLVQWDSHPQRRRWHGHDDSQGAGWWLLTRTTADGHRITFGLGNAGWAGQPRTIGWVTLGVLLLLTALAYAYVRHLMRPLKDIGQGALRFGAGEFGTPIRVRRHDELGDLAAQVNAMAANLHRMLDAKRELLLAISHELRSPLTRARLNAELVDEGSANQVPREALLRDLALMGALIGDLLESERLAEGAQGGHSALQLEPTDLNALMHDLLASEFAGAPLQLELAALPTLQLDRVRMRLLLRNLVDNALRHSAGAAQPPVITTTHSADGTRLSVRDFGPGVAEEHLPRLAEAFYRADAARQRATGGVGLGLHLCRLIARAHGGELRIANAQPGLRVEVVLPMQP